ncbi:hypothetical protein [Sphingomonas echinoides]|uniref:hypothetical protein n=1 Tax=Sphingomonas echinoides TaxID=59803 RepID=UPI0024134187|nr:hypothetical protein [Sphingomonas echinoides]
MSDDEEALNLRAYLAMSRINAHAERRLAELLRSEVPIHRIVRDALADAIEGKNAKDRVTLKVVEKTAGPLGGSAESRHKFHRDMEIVRFITERMTGPARTTRERALEEAASRFHESEATCDKALGKGTKFRQWVSQHYPDRPGILQELTDERYRQFLQAEYHYLLTNDRLNDGNRFT